MCLFITLLTAFSLLSCSGKKEYIKLKISFTCTPAAYFNSLKTVLLSNSYADLEGKDRKSFYNRLFAGRVYAKDLQRLPGDVFILDSVEKRTYAYLYIETYISDALFSGITRNLDFRKTAGDTAEIKVCMQGAVRVVNN